MKKILWEGSSAWESATLKSLFRKVVVVGSKKPTCTKCTSLEFPTLPTKGDKMKIKILEVGEIQSNILDIIANNLNKRFKNKFYFGGKIDIPENSYDKFKDQCDSETILKTLKNEMGKNEKVVGITSKDIYFGELNFVFGMSAEDVCVISTARLDPQFYENPANFDVLIKRVLKEIIHEVGHMFGLKHCSNQICVMNFSNSVSYVDDKKDEFCKDCTLKISMEDIRI